ncbi:MAG: DNA methyltransferase, partial [Rhodohalobacter sp.]|uniref:Eco57I restriction-modification methylase domain-containing protein n=1 Tax=Rhodohalobacter sp. TaxID=1974210 RepID=UPI003976B095
MALFQSAVLKKYLSGVDEKKVDDAWEAFTAHFHNAEIQENIREAKEESYQEGFLDDMFVKVLGYTKNPTPNYNLVVEQKNLTDSKKADGALLDGDEVRGVIELKGTETTDLGKVESQAFGYKNKQPDALYVVISNFEKLRFYIDNAVDFLEFNLFTLNKEEFKVLWLCLGYSNFAKGQPKKIKDASLTEEENVTKKLYKDYSAFKSDIFESVKAHNPEYDNLLLFKKTQKLLDRFLFIFFAEDRNLLPPNSIRKIIQQWQQLKELDEYRPLYERFVKYFGYLNEGRNMPGKDEIFAYNGGLFAEDEILDNLTISDELLYKHTLKLSTYDFVSEVDVNILGHIFEHSLNEIEEITAELEGQEVDTSKTRRKKDGVFYTPKYITKYIVENTVGKLCEEQKAELDIVDEEYRPNRQKKTKKELLDKLEQYRAWLLDLTICDPACGSGAFLNQALEFLIDEHTYVDELQAKLLGESLVFPDVENQILENNLFGVDINEESVEIAKLSLWLRTAQKGRKLTSLNNHIKCGNSLIDDPDVAGDKAFYWEEEFPEVFRQKEKQAFHVTWVTHNARTSQRMNDYKVKKGEPIWLNEELEIFITQEIAEIVKEDELNVLAYNICEDHVHILLVCEPDALPNIVRKLKG